MRWDAWRSNIEQDYKSQGPAISTWCGAFNVLRVILFVQDWSGFSYRFEGWHSEGRKQWDGVLFEGWDFAFTAGFDFVDRLDSSLSYVHHRISGYEQNLSLPMNRFLTESNQHSFHSRQLSSPNSWQVLSWYCQKTYQSCQGACTRGSWFWISWFWKAGPLYKWASDTHNAARNRRDFLSN